MKALIISEDENVYTSLNNTLIEAGYDTIIYKWLLKALDNIEEIRPDCIVVSSSEYPRHWKTLVQFVKSGIGGDDVDVYLYEPNPMSTEDEEKARILGITDYFTSLEPSVLEQLFGKKEEAVEVEKTVVQEAEPVVESEPEQIVEPAPEPVVKPEPQFGEATGWAAIEKKITQAPEGGSLDIDMKDTTILPAKAVEAIKGNDVTLVLKMENGASWAVNGKDNTGEIKDMDLGVELNTNSVPDGVVNSVAGGKDSMQIKTNTSNPPKVKGKLTIPVNVKHSDLIANLYQYDQKNRVKVAGLKSVSKKESDHEANKQEQESDQGVLKYMSCGVVKHDGTVELDFDGTSLVQDETAEQSFVIVFAEKSLDPTAVVDESGELTLKSKVKKGKVSLSWNKIKGAKKYRVYQKIGSKYKTISTLKKTSLTVTKAYQTVKKNGKSVLKKKKLAKNKKYVFLVKAYVDGKWTKKNKSSTKTVKAK